MISTLKRIRAHRRAHHKRQKQPLLPPPNTTPETATELDLTIPDIFLCPISLDLMIDPVILPSGITYDRSSIDKWLLDYSSSSHSTCPVTNHHIPTPTTLEITPNHTLRRTIQDWCVEHGLDRIPTPRAPITSTEVVTILHEFESLAETGELDRCLRILARMKEIGAESERNRRCIVENGGGRVLASVFGSFILNNNNNNNAAMFDQLAVLQRSDRKVLFLEEVMSALSETIGVVVDDDVARKHLETESSLKVMIWFMKRADNTTTMTAAKSAGLILSEITDRLEIVKRLIKIEGSVDVLITMLRDDNNRDKKSLQRDALKTLFNIASEEETRSALRGVGVVSMLLEVLIEPKLSREVCEAALGMLNVWFDYEEGREEAYKMSVLAVPILVKKMLRVSEVATALSVSAVWKLCKGENGDDESGYGRWCCKVEALQVGAFQKLLLILQMGCEDETKERGSELLKWLNSCRVRNGGYECINSSDFKNLERSFE